MALASKPPTVLQGTDKITRENSSSMSTNWDHRIHPSSSHGVPWNTRKWQERYKEKEENAEPQGQDILESRIQEQKMLPLSFSSTLQILVLNQSIIEKCALWLQFSHLKKQHPADRLDHGHYKQQYSQTHCEDKIKPWSIILWNKKREKRTKKI